MITVLRPQKLRNYEQFYSSIIGNSKFVYYDEDLNNNSSRGDDEDDNEENLYCSNKRRLV